MYYQLILSQVQIASQVTNPALILSISLALALIPIAVCLLTSFVKLSIVLGVLKNALGTQHAPSGMVTMALSLSLTMIIMQSVIHQSLNISKNIDLDKLSKSSSAEIVATLQLLSIPWKAFLQKNTGKRELSVLNQISPQDNAENRIDSEKNNMLTLVPAFLLSELKEGFCMAFLLLVPFLAVDLIVANILMGLGMMMLSPVIISLPIKLILFVYSDAWLLISQALIKSYEG